MKKDSDKDSPEESGEVAREQKGQDKEDTRGWSPWPSYRSNRHGPTAGVETIATRKLKKGMCMRTTRGQGIPSTIKQWLLPFQGFLK
jgi:hypothetical protein